MTTAQLETTAAKPPTQAALLQQTLVELIDLSLQGKQAHWNVVGPTFKPVHEFLDELVDEYRDWYDMVAERMTAIGVAPDGRVATLAATTPLSSLAAGPLPERIVLAAFDERVSSVATSIRTRADQIGETDLATQDLLIEILRGLDKQRWMIRAHLS
jgi:starvation-inducible DNA-binding protein